MTLFCVFKYFKNESVVSVSYKVFHDTPDDVYPSISICLRATKVGPFVDTNDISREDISDMMRGLTKYNQSLLMNITYEDMTIKLPVERLTYVTLGKDMTYTKPCVGSNCFVTYGDGGMKCFTHDIQFFEGKIYKRLTIQLKKTKQIMDAVMTIYFHYPGQLFRAGNDPVVEGIYHQKATRIQRRKAGKEKCYSASFDDDRNLFQNLVKKYNCSFKYTGQYLLNCNINIDTTFQGLIQKMLHYATLLNSGMYQGFWKEN